MDRHPNTCMGCDGALAFNKEKLCGSCLDDKWGPECANRECGDRIGDNEEYCIECEGEEDE